jgi:hypothetical protein
MVTAAWPKLTARGLELDLTPEAFGLLRASSQIANDAAALRARMQEDGYLFLPGLLDREEVLTARRVITGRLAAEGHLDPDHPELDAVARPGVQMTFRPDLALHNPPLDEILYSGPIMDFCRRFFGEEVRHYDYTWFRAAAPGLNASPHCDVVYMGRGTFDVLTVWTPLGDIPIDGGALMVLEGSHQKRAQLEDYLGRDVDSYCLDSPNAARVESEGLHEWDGILDHDAVGLRQRLGGRWLTHEFGMGDVLVFTLGTVHASLDNLSNRIRLSSDSRYQRAGEPADERWIGENPVGHGPGGKQGLVC